MTNRPGEMRLNRLTNEWVIIAPGRALRPHDTRIHQAPRALVPYQTSCPFCAGNEKATGGEVMHLDGPDGAWRTRVVPNRYPALEPSLGPAHHVRDGVKEWLTGFGHHEVIIESPRHDATLATMSDGEVADVVRTYRERYRAIRDEEGVAHVLVFKNHGAAAGSSLAHPHSQLMATPVVSHQVVERMKTASAYQREHGECLVCRLMHDELTDGVRVVTLTASFLAVVPYAALSSFHTWIVPRRHMRSFADLSDDEASDLATVVRRTLRQLFLGLGDPPFNLVVRSAPRTADDSFHWYLTIVPRVGHLAGFELGSGMYINAAWPEESAAFLRAVDLR